MSPPMNARTAFFAFFALLLLRESWAKREEMRFWLKLRFIARQRVNVEQRCV
jgi:hypothetical protein